jgi:hypothetical protein
MKKLILSTLLLAFVTVAMSANTETKKTESKTTTKSLKIEVSTKMQKFICPICADLYERLDNLGPITRMYIRYVINRLKARFKAHPEIKNQHEKFHKIFLRWIKMSERERIFIY